MGRLMLRPFDGDVGIREVPQFPWKRSVRNPAMANAARAHAGVIEKQDAAISDARVDMAPIPPPLGAPAKFACHLGPQGLRPNLARDRIDAETVMMSEHDNALAGMIE